MKPLYAIRDYNVIEVVHLRGKLYCPLESINSITTQGGKLYSANELLIGEKNLFPSREDAMAVLKCRNQAKLSRQQREDEAIQKQLEERDQLVKELLSLADEKGVDVLGIGFASNEQLEAEIYKLKNI